MEAAAGAAEASMLTPDQKTWFGGGARDLKQSEFPKGKPRHPTLTHLAIVAHPARS